MMTNSGPANKFLQNPVLLILFIIFILVSSCTTKRELIHQNELIKVSQPRVFTKSFKNGLYKTNMVIYGRELSGLLFFNKNENSMRTVMLSEFGLKYFDVEYAMDGEIPFMVHHIIEFLNHEKFIYSFENFLELIMIDTDRTADIHKDADNPIMFIREENRNNKTTTFIYNSNTGAVGEIYQKKAGVKLTNYDYMSPGAIEYKHGKTKFSLVKVEKE